MSMQHTPGPWVTGYDGHGGIYVEDTQGLQIGFVSAGTVQEANACLIAAAPMLLEALKSLVDEYEPNLKTFALNAPRRAKWMAALDAIANATVAD